MANTFAPFGFRQLQGTGASPTYEQTQMAIASGNTTPIFFGDPVVMQAGTTGLSTGYINQAYGPVTLTVGATAITTNATTGALTVTFTAATSTSGNLPTSPNTWAPPVGSYMTITGSTMTSGNLNGTFLVTSSSTTTAVCANAGATINGTSSASGTVTVYVPVAGICAGCKYLSTAQKRSVWGNYAPGSDYNGDVTAYVINDPAAQFLVQTGNSNTTATAVPFSATGQNIGFNYSQSGAVPATVNGNTSNGISTFFADQYSLIANSGAGPVANPFLPFRIIGPAGFIPGATATSSAASFLGPWGSPANSDLSSAYNTIVVGFNNMMFKQFSGI